jgi:hypothetical protein
LRDSSDGRPGPGMTSGYSTAGRVWVTGVVYTIFINANKRRKHNVSFGRNDIVRLKCTFQAMEFKVIKDDLGSDN